MKTLYWTIWNTSVMLFDLLKTFELFKERIQTTADDGVIYDASIAIKHHHIYETSVKRCTTKKSQRSCSWKSWLWVNFLAKGFCTENIAMSILRGTETIFWEKWVH